MPAVTAPPPHPHHRPPRRRAHQASKDAFQAEMKRLGAMRHTNLLPPLAYHYRRDEKLLLYEYIPKGSLRYVLHGDRGMDYAALSWPTRLKVVVGVARGTGFLHGARRQRGAHGNLRSAARDGLFERLLVDFDFSGLISHMQSPYCVRVLRPECATSHHVSALADVYCLELLTGKFPSQYLQNANGGTDLVM